MKRTKKLLAAVLAMLMVFAMSLTASAATIVIDDGDAEGSTYHAYKLLDAKCAVDDSDELLIAYTLNEKYVDVLRTTTGYTEGADIISYIGGLKNEEIRAFADSVYGQVKSMEADYITTSNEFTDVDQGYYLIVEALKGDETYSLVMLDTAGEDTVTVISKESVPELVKKVQEKNDTDGTVSDWQDGADYDIGDAVLFQLTGTVAQQYEDYATYYYAFHDTLSAGLTLDPASVVVKVDETVITEGYEIVTENLEDDCSFEIRFADLKTVSAVTKDSKIVVEYSATLTEDAVIGPEGNPNTAKLEYCNNPYFDGTDGGSEDEDPTSETPVDKVIVFTYELDVNKVDKDEQPLEGAGFTLYKLVMPQEASEDAEDAEDAEAEYVMIGEEIVSTPELPITEFKFTGLDAGQYKLVETTVPEGYIQMEDIEFTIAAVYDTEADDPEFTELTVELVLEEENPSEDEDTSQEGSEEIFAVTDGVISTKVVNLTGLLLPSTGGIGTVIFYIIGAVLMIGAVVLFVKGRRSEEKN